MGDSLREYTACGDKKDTSSKKGRLEAEVKSCLSPAVQGPVEAVQGDGVAPQVLQVSYKYPTAVIRKGLPCGSDGKHSAHNAGDLGLIPVLGKSPGERNGYPLQYPCLGNPMWPGGLQSMSSQRLSNLAFHFHPEEKIIS